jgi:DNA repair protein RadD
VPYTGFAYDVPDLRGVHKSGADYKQDELGRAMSGNKIAGNIVEQWLAHCRGRRTVLFAVNIAHSLDLVQRFKDAGVAAEHVDGECSTEEREGVLRRFASGETTVVCNVQILGEGYDLPAIECVVLARPTLSLVVYLQQVGRGLRPRPASRSAASTTTPAAS